MRTCSSPATLVDAGYPIRMQIWVVQLYLTIWESVDCSMSGFPVLHHLSDTNSCPLSQWCHPAILSSVAPFSTSPQSFPASGSVPMSQLFASGSQTIGASASASVLPMHIQEWFPLGLTGLISLSSPAVQFKSIRSSALSLLYGPTFTSLHDY